MFHAYMLSWTSQFLWFRGCHAFTGFIGFEAVIALLALRVSWFCWFHSFKGCHGFTGFVGFTGFPDFRRCHGLAGFVSFMVSLVSWVS